jgi:Fe-S-cluster-containing hydrogenase component 2
MNVGDCISACPVSAIVIVNDKAFIVAEDCTDCAACEPVCDAKAVLRVH